MSQYSTKSHSLLKDNSWIKKQDDEDEDIDRDPNYGKSVLSHRSSETPTSPVAKDASTTKTTRTSAHVQALTKRFSTSQDEVDNSTLPSGKKSYTKSSTTTRTSTGDPSTTTTTVTKDSTSETTITTTTTKTVRSPVISSPTQTFTERVLSSSKDAQYSSYSPTKTTKVTETTITNTKDAQDKLFETLVPSPVKDNSSLSDSKTVTTTETVTVRSSADKYAEDKLYDTLIPSSIKDDYSPTDSKTNVYSTKSVTVRSSTSGDDFKTTTTTRTSSSSSPEDELYGSLIPDAIKSPVSIKKREIIATVDSSRGLQSPTLSSPSSSRKTVSYSSYPDDVSTTRTTSYTISSKPSETYSSEHTSYSYSRPQSSYEYSGISSPTSYSSSLYRSRSEELLSDPLFSKSSYKTSSVLEKDLCTYCHKPFNGDAKMVLDDMKINCHASCFKCQVCKNTLGHMRAGDSIWIYKHMVHCENCFDITREKWRR